MSINTVMPDRGDLEPLQVSDKLFIIRCKDSYKSSLFLITFVMSQTVVELPSGQAEATKEIISEECEIPVTQESFPPSGNYIVGT